MAQEVFKRTEKKYLVDKDTYPVLVSRLEEYMNRDRYYESEIMSLYFDTPDYRLIRQSVEKPVFKEKIRLRSYGVPAPQDKVFLEIKRKYKGVVYKRRIVLPYSDALDFISGRDVRSDNPQIARELRQAFSFYSGLAPKMMISYHRFAYSGKEDSSLRVTFDDRILFRNDGLALDEGIHGRQLLSDGTRIMEIKIPGSMPLWLSHLLDELKIYPASYSKYGTAYVTLLKEGSLFRQPVSAV